MVLIDGKKIAGEIRKEIADEVIETEKKLGRKPCLAVILVGNDYGSTLYVRNKEKACEEVGMRSIVQRLPEETTQQELLDIIDGLNKKDDVDGIMVQLPLPKHIDEATVVDAISPKKDADGLHTVSCGRLLQGKKGFLPCTPHGVIELLDRSGCEIEGKNAVVIGRSNIVGKPVALMLLARNATVTVCHSRTKDIGKITREADIVVVAVGKAGFLTADMVKPGAAVIDVGMNRKPDGKATGDVDFEAVREVAGYITPVPGGVGPMTITMLLYNTLESAKNNG